MMPLGTDKEIEGLVIKKCLTYKGHCRQGFLEQ